MGGKTILETAGMASVSTGESPLNSRRRKIAKALILLLSISLHLFGQAPTGKVHVNGSCIIANSGNKVTIDFKKCGIGEEQGKKILDLLKQIIDNQAKLQPDVVIHKLDECLNRLNPNLPAKVYSCRGTYRTMGIGHDMSQEISGGGDTSDVEAMITLNNNHQWAALLDKCTAEIKDKPEWLTPGLFCAIANMAMGNEDRAKKLLDEYDSKKGPAYDDPHCTAMDNYLHEHLQ